MCIQCRYVTEETVDTQAKQVKSLKDILVSKQKEVTVLDLRTLETRHQTLLQDAFTKRYYHPSSEEILGVSESPWEPLWKLFSSRQEHDNVLKLTEQRQRKEREIEVLQTAFDSEYKIYAELIDTLSKTKRAQTLKGRFFNLLGWILSGYGVYK